MKARRLWWSLRTALTQGGRGRADYARKEGIYAHVGNGVSIQSRVIPVYSELISFGNNVAIARNVDFCTHDITHNVLNRLPEEERNQLKFKERIGCIKILDNVFVGSNSVILYGTQIGPNVIVGSGSVVVKDCEPNSVYVGVPAKKVGTFEDFISKRIQGESEGTIATTTHNQKLTDEEIKNAWEIFDKAHQQG